MDLSIITRDWSYDEDEECQNVRKITGVDGRMKIQLRIRCGVVQWEVKGRPDGQKPHGFPSFLDYCAALLARQAPGRDASQQPADRLNADLVHELVEELFDYYRRSRALLHLADYRSALDDVLHNLEILRMIREACPDETTVFNYDRYRPSLTADRARAEMLLHLKAGDPRRALDTLTTGICDVEAFYAEYELADGLAESPERQMLVDLRRSLRAKHNVPLNDQELLQSLKAEQEIAIGRENYEMAARLRDKINLLLQKTAPLK